MNELKSNIKFRGERDVGESTHAENAILQACWDHASHIEQVDEGGIAARKG